MKLITVFIFLLTIFVDISASEAFHEASGEEHCDIQFQKQISSLDKSCHSDEHDESGHGDHHCGGTCLNFVAVSLELIAINSKFKAVSNNQFNYFDLYKSPYLNLVNPPPIAS